ncbi:MAG TPA: lipoyl synthase [Planctomycetota bacterium]|nr:lipoyl synthase [Planctomycetota bacterium]
MLTRDEDPARGNENAQGFVPLPVLAAPPRRPRRYPSWIKVRYSENERYLHLREKVRSHSLHTVCEEAECPNIGECWAHGTATFMLLGDTCTRGCQFCAVGRGKPGALDPSEPMNVAEVAADLGLDYVVLTSVNRDDLPDEGAEHFAKTIRAIARRIPHAKVEALVPDFHARRELIERVVLTPLHVFAHNVETVPRLYRRVRAGSDYRRSLETLKRAKEVARSSPDRAPSLPGVPILTKSSLMLGLGETRRELLEVFADLREHDVDVLTLGQYLQPSAHELEVFRFVPPGEFDDLRREAERMGFRHVVSSPMSRSSYHAWEVAGEAEGPPAG